MAIKIKVDNESDVKQTAKEYLQNKGVDENTADYLAELFSKSEEGKKLEAAKEIQPAGSCALPGLFPG